MMHCTESLVTSINAIHDFHICNRHQSIPKHGQINRPPRGSEAHTIKVPVEILSPSGPVAPTRSLAACLHLGIAIS